MIEIKNLSFSYNLETKKTLNNISMTIKDGTFVSILGHNGSGKTTLSKLIIGIEKAQEGEIIVDGLVLNEQNLPKILNLVGLIFQNPDNQFVGIDVLHDLSFGMENRCIDLITMKEKIAKYSALLKVDHLLDKSPDTLSGGQKQRVAIAGMLALDIKFYIFDEATSMLDPQGVNDVYNLIKFLSETKKKTVINITHDLDFALQSDYLFFLKEGHLELEGTPKDCFSSFEKIKNLDLELPYKVDVLFHVLNDVSLKNNERLVNFLWELCFKK